MASQQAKAAVAQLNSYPEPLNDAYNASHVNDDHNIVSHTRMLAPIEIAASRTAGDCNAKTDVDDLHDESSVQFFSLATLKVSLPNILIPTLYGYHIGLVGVYTTMYGYATNCQLYKSKRACETLDGVKCKWTIMKNQSSREDGYLCTWRDKTTCYTTYFEEGPCKQNKDCVWDYAGKTCGNQVGYTSTQAGLFAGSMVIGAMVGSLLGGVLTKRLNFRLSFLLIGVLSCISAVLTHISTALFIYWLLFVARLILGFAMGWQAFAAPSYTDKFSPKSLQKTLGVFFQVFTAFGCFVTAIFGISLGNTIHYSADVNARVMGRMQGLLILPTILGLLVLFLPLVTHNEMHTNAISDPLTNLDNVNDTHAMTGARYNRKKVVSSILMGFVMAATLQLTGINANMNYAPVIMGNLGLNALLGNFVVMLWNAIVAFGAIPLSKRFTMRVLFLFFTLIGSISCLFLCGIPVYPGISKAQSTKNGVAIFGIFVFIAAYELGIGPCFFVLTVDIFPPAFRHIGSAITTSIMFILNVIINVCYPIATQGISGGPSGNQDKGQSIAFIFFGCVGFVTVTIEYFFLHPWQAQTVQA